MIMEEKQKSLLSHKLLLILIKYIPHTIALFYGIYNILGILGIDFIIAGYFIHMSILPWIFMYLLSFIFRYCYIHRLPLYYILSSEILTTLDYLLDYSIEESVIIMSNLVLILAAIFGYTFYYIKYKLKKNERFQKILQTQFF